MTIKTRQIWALMLLISAVVGTKTLQAKEVEISCEVYGKVADVEEWKTQTIVKGSYKVNPQEIPFTQRDNEGGCRPHAARSQVFGEENGTKLQIAAWKCGSDDVYATFEVVINGLPVMRQMTNGLGRVVINDEGGARGLPPIVLPEGSFEWIYADCMEKN